MPQSVPQLLAIGYMVLLVGVSLAILKRGYLPGRLSRRRAAVVLGIVWASFPWVFGLTYPGPFIWGAAITLSVIMFATMSISFAWVLRRVPRDGDSGSKSQRP